MICWMHCNKSNQHPSISEHDDLSQLICYFIRIQLLFFSTPGHPHNWRQRLEALNWNPIEKESHSSMSPHVSFFWRNCSCPFVCLFLVCFVFDAVLSPVLVSLSVSAYAATHSQPLQMKLMQRILKNGLKSLRCLKLNYSTSELFLATLVAQHFTPVSQ